MSRDPIAHIEHVEGGDQFSLKWRSGKSFYEEVSNEGAILHEARQLKPMRLVGIVMSYHDDFIQYRFDPVAIPKIRRMTEQCCLPSPYPPGYLTKDLCQSVIHSGSDFKNIP